MLDLITIGDIKLDTFVVLPKASIQCELKMPECQLCIEYGKKISVDDVESQIAGTAPNVAVGIARMKNKAGIVSVMGEDGIRKMALEHLKREGVETTAIESVKGAQSSFSVILNFKGEKTSLTSHIKHTYQLPSKLPKTKWMFVGEMGHGYEKLFSELATYIKKENILFAINPGGVQIEDRKPALMKLLKHTEVLFVNREEGQMLAKAQSKEIHGLMTMLHALGPKLVVVTDSRGGSYSFNGTDITFCPMFPGERVEATGAGDSFATGYLGALMHRKHNGEALRWGSVNASSVVQFVGPQKGLLSAGQIQSRLRKDKEFKVQKM